MEDGELETDFCKKKRKKNNSTTNANDIYGPNARARAFFFGGTQTQSSPDETLGNSRLGCVSIEWFKLRFCAIYKQTIGEENSVCARAGDGS